MEIFFIIVILMVIALFYAPFMFDGVQAILPFGFKIKNTIIFGIIGIIFSLQIDPFPIINVFAGMIAGSMIDLLLRDKQI